MRRSQRDRPCAPQTLDMAKDTADPVLDQLKKLREGRGLSADRLRSAPAVLSSLATSDPFEAYEALQRLLWDLPDSEQMRALVIDYGFNLDDLLGREPSSREVDRLGERRAAYAELVGRDVKTIARWSDKTLGELRGHLLADYFDGHVLVAAGVKGARIIGIEVMQYEKSDEHFSHGTTTTYTNPEPGPSLPLVLYGFPREWRPETIRFVVSFFNEPPDEAWVIVADTVLDVGFGHTRTPLPISDGLARCVIRNPRRSQLYGVGWGCGLTVAGTLSPPGTAGSDNRRTVQ